MGKIWTVCSGSGGVGKSMIALSLASGAAKAGNRVILLDASGIARSCDLILGLESIVVLDMLDVISGQAGIDAALYPVSRYEGLRFACASLYDAISAFELSGIVIALHSLCDILIVDMPTGQASLGTGIMSTGDERVLVTRPDDISMRAADRMMRQSDDKIATSIVINRVNRDRIKRKTQYLQNAVQAVLDCPVISCIPEDISIPTSEQKRRAAIECDGPAWTALRDLLQTLLRV